MDADALRATLEELPTPALRKSLAEDVLDRLREAIVRGHFEPGQRLSEPMLAEAFDVSRGPVHDALARLEQEGLIVIQKRKGATVAKLSLHDVEEIYGLRVALERLAVERVTRLANEEDFVAMDSVVDALEGAAQDGEARRAVDLDLRFHDLIYRAAHHSRLYLFWTQLRPQMYAFLLSRSTGGPDDLTTDDLRIFAEEHAEIRDVLRSGDGERAVTLIEDHLKGAYERLLNEPFE